MWAETIWGEHPTLGKPKNLVTDAIAQAAAVVAPRKPEDINLPKPQPGAQTTFYDSEADITIFGGAAGAGKSRALLARAAQWVNVPGYGAVLFRLTSPEITNEGGLWDASIKTYSDIKGAKYREGELDWSFPWNSAISFRHTDKLQSKFYGAEIAYIGVDELQFWKEEDFWFLLTRNRSTCGITPRLDATCNPDCDSFVANLVSWWIDPNTGYPIEERSGVLRYFYRIEEEVIWADTPQELKEQFPELAAIAPPKSFTFIKGTIYDNPELLRTNPQYLANLLSQHPVLMERLLKGNWKVRMNKGDSLFTPDAITTYNIGKWLSAPEANRFYMACIDPNYGGKNFWVCQVWDITQLPFKVVAQYRENYKKPLYCRQESQKLMKQFGVIFLAVEADNGGVVIAEQIALEMPKVHVEVTRSSNISKIVNTDRIATAHEQGDVIYPPDWIGMREMENFSALTRAAIVENEQINDDTITCWAAGWAWLEVALSLRVKRNYSVGGIVNSATDRLNL